MRLNISLVNEEICTFRPVHWYQRDDGTMDDRRQIEKIQEEFAEALEAYRCYKEHPSKRNRMKLACEIVDLITAGYTFLDGSMSHEDMVKTIIITNLKNELSGYNEEEPRK